MYIAQSDATKSLVGQLQSIRDDGMTDLHGDGRLRTWPGGDFDFFFIRYLDRWEG